MYFYDLINLGCNLFSVKPQPVAPPTPEAPKPSATPIIPAARLPIGEDKTEQIKGMAKVMVKTMTEANSIPTFGYCDEIDVSNLVGLREAAKDITKETGVRFSYMPVIIKVTVRVNFLTIWIT